MARWHAIHTASFIFNLSCCSCLDGRTLGPLNLRCNHRHLATAEVQCEFCSWPSRQGVSGSRRLISGIRAKYRILCSDGIRATGHCSLALHVNKRLEPCCPLFVSASCVKGYFFLGVVSWVGSLGPRLKPCSSVLCRLMDSHAATRSASPAGTDHFLKDLSTTSLTFSKR